MEQDLRNRWHATKLLYEEQGGVDLKNAHDVVHVKLSKYLLDRAQAQIDEDRRKHPKAKRNQPPPPNSTPNRVLP